ncbi:MAG: malic enzyme-like NAD(P)-binding protein [Candidatus Marinimicrobia bacterium]|nr:malic enzyme-like NAD(P)-binding protein [Candidatus Neomarinimicrobiota bacterium]
MDSRERALQYHRRPLAGKTSVKVTKDCRTQEDLSLAYTPGVAEPCREIERAPADIYAYTNKGNLVAVVTNGTAVLGLGNIGPEASKPVMEGKSVLFKRFADVDAFDIELKVADPDALVNIVKAMEPTFGGINLEDIRAPECFYIEDRLKKEMQIPVFHDDQHGTAIISGAALLNACEVQNKKLEECRIVISGAGAAAIACALHYERLGARHENIVMCDRKGVLRPGREEIFEPNKRYFFASTRAKTLAEALKGADIFVGLSAGNIVSPEMIRDMAPNPALFPMANPVPEIRYETIKAVRPDAVAGTGRSDDPNQVNNVLGFPFIFRGALDVRASAINEAMEVAATKALSDLAKEPCIDAVKKAYNGREFEFGPGYLIPKPFDPRVFVHEAFAVADAAVRSGTARLKPDMRRYRESLEKRLEIFSAVYG